MYNFPHHSNLQNSPIYREGQNIKLQMVITFNPNLIHQHFPSTLSLTKFFFQIKTHVKSSTCNTKNTGTRNKT